MHTTPASKRLLDLTLVILTMPLWGPVIGALALAVLICDGRPVFFPQPRVGQNNRRFVIWKLRSMTRETEAKQRRPTALGRRLRHHGLDELPQLLNVFAGHMSLVGPRPLEPADVERLANQCPAFAQNLGDRQRLRPGLTGMAQVCNARGPALTAALDAHYAHKWTLGLDLAILVRTAWINLVGKSRGAQRVPPELAQTCS
jgi:lipopolysaccharide/colanic/teichoic acid biosynthesis glycosyltransferase